MQKKNKVLVRYQNPYSFHVNNEERETQKKTSFVCNLKRGQNTREGAIEEKNNGIRLKTNGKVENHRKLHLENTQVEKNNNGLTFFHKIFFRCTLIIQRRDFGFSLFRSRATN